jgi:hypothetical protein
MEMLKYENFLLEKLILESNVIYSDKFRKALTKMTDNQIAKQLLEIENKDIDVLSNYFDLKNDNENVITFTPDKVAQEIIKSNKELFNYVGGGGCMTNNMEANAKIFQILGYTPKVDKCPVYHPRNDEAGEIISKTTSEKTGKTWCYVKFPTGEGVYDETKLRKANIDLNKTMFDKSRQEIRIGRGIRLLLGASGITVRDSDIEKFVNDFRATVKVMNDIFSNFEIVDGEKLLYWYHRKNYLEPNRGTLGTSCQAVGRPDWLEIYIKNPETVKLVILKSPDFSDKIIGRALLWNLDDGHKMMDYIYTSKDSDRKIFVDYAKHNGWYQVDEDGSRTYTAHLTTRGEFDKYPSVDTMNNWNHETGEISNRSFPGSKDIIWSNDGDGDDWNDDDDDDNDDDY